MQKNNYNITKITKTSLFSNNFIRFQSCFLTDSYYSKLFVKEYISKNKGNDFQSFPLPKQADFNLFFSQVYTTYCTVTANIPISAIDVASLALISANGVRRK